MKRYKIPFLIFFILILGTGIVSLMVQKRSDYTHSFVMSPFGTCFAIRIADTEALREQGLSGVSSMPEDRGMLFTFEKQGLYAFWMKGMNFPLDILWLAPTGASDRFRIVHIEQNLTPESYPKTFSSEVSANMVLEVNAFTAEKTGMILGSLVTVDISGRDKMVHDTCKKL